MTHEESIEKQMEELALKANILKLIRTNNLPEPKYIHTHEAGLGYEVKDLTEARELAKLLWKYQVDAAIWKPKGFTSYFRIEPYKGDTERGDDCSLVLNTTYYSHSGADTKLSFYICPDTLTGLLLKVYISMTYSPVRITSKHEYYPARRGKAQQVARYRWEYFGLETGHTERYSSANELPHFVEYFSGIDEVDLDKILRMSN